MIRETIFDKDRAHIYGRKVNHASAVPIDTEKREHIARRSKGWYDTHRYLEEMSSTPFYK
jgi:hypothetical protein